MAVHEDLIRFRLLKCEERHGRVRRDVHTRVIVCMSILYRNKKKRRLTGASTIIRT